ncbi:hypothetical protein QR680_000111 [Steinernema hermaphroditum]|nr:hypothetical protein QR680_000111 [Steinernema hermaphroditum]
MASEFDRIEGRLSSPAPTNAPGVEEQGTSAVTPEMPATITNQLSSLDTFVISATAETIADVVHIGVDMDITTTSNPLAYTPSTISETSSNASDVVEVIINSSTVATGNEEVSKSVDNEPAAGTALPEFLNRLTNLTLDVSKETGVDGDREKEKYQSHPDMSHVEEVDGQEVVTTPFPKEEAVPMVTVVSREPYQTTIVPKGLAASPTAFTTEIPYTTPKVRMETYSQEAHEEKTEEEKTKADSPEVRKFEVTQPQTVGESVPTATKESLPSITTDIPEYSLFEKIIGGIRCSIRDCRGVLRPTQTPPRTLKNSTIIRRARFSCQCPPIGVTTYVY